jgi:hypothetical protein
MAKSLLAGKLNKDKVQKASLTPEQIETMHNAMTATPQPTAAAAEAVIPTPQTPTITKSEAVEIPTVTTKTAAKPKIETQKVVAAPTEEPTAEVITRLSIDVNKEMHKAMKMRVIETEQSIRDYVVGLIKKDLGF